MRNVLRTKLDALLDEVLRMATLVDEAIGKATRSLVERDPTLARAVIEGDERIDTLEVEIEERCLAILALEQPVATDLRVVSTALKIVTDLERMGDYASNVAKVALRLGDEEFIKPLVDIPRMAEIDRRMLRSAVQAFLRRDVELAQSLERQDDEVDALYNQIFRDLLGYMIEDPSTRVVNQATQLIMVARHLERIGDHVTNFADWVVFMVSGERRP
jgi:phosphate transport system protein